MCSFVVWTACSAQFTISADGKTATGPGVDGRVVVVVGYSVGILPYNIRAKVSLLSLSRSLRLLTN